MATPFQRVPMDIVGLLAPVSERENQYILTVVDYATRYPEAIPLRKIDTESVAEALPEVFCLVGFPTEILNDRGAQFISGLMQEIEWLVQVKHLFTTHYNPWCNGLCEQVNRILKAMLRKMCQERPQNWDRYFPAVLFAYREVPQASTGFSPFELLYGRTVRGPMQASKGLWTEEDAPKGRNTYEYVLSLRNWLEETCELPWASLLQAQGKQKHHCDKKAKDRKFKVDQKVLVLLPSDHNKLLLQWKGLNEVIEVVRQCDYKVQVRGKARIYHANLLKQYTEREEGREKVAAVAIIEPEHEVDGVVDDESLLELNAVKGQETHKDVLVNPELTQEQKAEVEALVKEFAEVLTDKPGTTDLVKHGLDTVNHEPAGMKQYPMPYAKQQAVEEEVKKMLDAGVIEQSNSAYNSSLVMVKKSDSSNRCCVDLRQINSITKFDAEPMPDIDIIMTRASQARFFTKTDMTKGYWPVIIDEESRPLTAFNTTLGSFQFTKMAFSLVNSAATFG